MDTILVVDVAHPPLHPERAEGILNDALRKIRLSSHLRILKIIHGYGSSGKGGNLKTTVKNWIYNNRKRIKCSINGEQVETFDTDVIELAAECDISLRDDLGFANEGMTIIWVK